MKTFGISINIFSPQKSICPLTDGAHAANKTSEGYGNVSACDYGTLSKDKVKGKIVYCLGQGTQDYTIKELGATGVIMAVNGCITFFWEGTYMRAKSNPHNNNINIVDFYS